MARRRNPLAQALTAGFTLGYLWTTARLPLALNRWCTVQAARALASLVPRVRRVTMENIDRAYGDTLTPQEKKALYRGAIDNVAIVAAEFAHLPKVARGEVSARITIIGEEHVAPDQGYLCIGAHLGNWELLAPFMAERGLKVAEVVRSFDNPRVDAAIDGIRQTGGVVTIPKDNAGADIIRHLKSGYMVGVLVDQSPRDSAVPVTFFGHPCWATIAPVMVAVRARVPVLPVSLTRNPDNSYTLQFYPTIEMERSGDARGDLVRNSQRCQDAIEAIVRAHPEQWLWLHRRWKERPRLAAEWERKLARDREKASRAGAPQENEETT